MAQISKRKLNEDIQSKMFEMFLSSFAKCENDEELMAYLSDILTETEAVVMAKRLAIALMLSKGYGYVQICDLLKVSPPTVSKVKTWLDLRGDGFRAVLKKVLEDKETEDFWIGLYKLHDREKKLVGLGKKR